MLRCGQMMLAQALVVRHLGRGLSLLSDLMLSNFSIYMVGYFNIRLFKVNFKFYCQLHPQVNCFQGSPIFIFSRLILFLQLKNLQSNLYGLYNRT